MNAMMIISTGITIVILGFLYWRMVKREIPRPVGWLQALLPIAIGLLSMPMTIPISMSYLNALAADPNAVKLNDLSFFQALERSFIVAGGLEEIAKLILILVVLLIFRKKVKNVYEYILIGACIGIGFTVFEEFYYGGSESATAFSAAERLISVSAHMTFNMVMGEFLGRAKFSKLNGKSSAVLYYVPALLIPIVVHSLYDVCTTFNSNLMRGEMSGMIRAAVGYAALLVFELVVLIRCKKKTELFCGMRTLAEETAA